MKYLAICLPFLVFIACGKAPIDSTLWKNLPEDCGTPTFTATEEKKEEKNEEETKEDKEPVQFRMINGTKAAVGQFPWMARLGNKRGKNITFHCAGSLIATKFVISAAHCTESGNLVRLGETTETKDSGAFQDIKVKRYIFEDFCRKSYRNDLMLVQLARLADLNEFVQPICLSHDPLPTSSLMDKTIITPGWSSATPSSTNSESDNLMFITVSVLDSDKCAPLHPEFNKHSQFCLDRTDERTVCVGDSGSGAVTYVETETEKRAYLIGITSYGNKDCSSNSVFTLVDYFIGSILKNIESYQDV